MGCCKALSVLALLLAFATAVPPAAADDVAAVNALLDRVERAYADHDEAALARQYCPDGMMVIAVVPGRPAGAIVAGREAALQGVTARWRAVRSHAFADRRIDVRDGVAWILTTIVDVMSEGPSRTSRFMMLAVRREGRWQMCFGVPLIARPAVVVRWVLPGSKPARAGLAAGDVVVALDGAAILSTDQLTGMLRASAEPGRLTAERGGRRFDVPAPDDPAQLQYVDRIVPADGATLVDADRGHPIMHLMEEELRAGMTADAERMGALFCPSGFFSVMPQPDGEAEIISADDYEAVFARAVEAMRERMDLTTARYEDMRAIVLGDVALASNRFVAKGRGPDAENIEYPSALEVYVRQEGRWGLAAILPRRIELGSEVRPSLVHTARQTARAERTVTGSYSGLGIGIEKADGGVLVNKVFPGGGGSEAGLRAGDLITHVDGQAAGEVPPEDVVGLILGPEGTTVRLTVVSEGQPPRDVVATRRKVELTGVTARMARDGVAVIDIDYFTPNTPGEVRKHVRQMARQGMAAIVLDLRANTGGLFSAILDTAELLIPPGKTMFVVRPAQGRSQPMRTKNAAVTNVPLVALVDARTGAGELLAAAVLQSGRGLVAGQQTSGVSENKRMVKRPDGSSELVVQGTFLLEPGRPITGVGVQPTIPLPAETPEDEALERAIDAASAAAKIAAQ